MWVIGNAAGTGCDAAPYFRVFNQKITEKFDEKEFTSWILNLNWGNTNLW
jgi:deoxyribodipyrimidine photolyase